MVAVKPLLNTQNAFYTTLVISAYVSVVGLAYITLVSPSVYQQHGKEQKPLSCEAACALHCGENSPLRFVEEQRTRLLVPTLSSELSSELQKIEWCSFLFHLIPSSSSLQLHTAI